MTKVYSSDLISANNSVMITQLQDTINNNSTLIDQLNNFKTDAIDNLEGTGYDVLMSKLSFYIDSLTKGNTICENLIAGIKSANNKMLNFMEGYEYLDDSEIENIKASLSAAERLLEWLKAYHTEYTTDPLTGDEVAVSVQNGTAEEISSCETTIATLKALLEKLIALAGEDSKDYQDVSNVENDVLGFGKALGNVNLAGRGIDTSNMTPEAKSLLDEYMKSWPADLSEERKAVIQKAFEYYGRGIKYSQDKRHNEGYFDCSSYLEQVFHDAGLAKNLPDTAWTGSFYLGDGIDFTKIEEFDHNNCDVLRPGDVMFFNKSTGDAPNHIVLYLGKDSNGNDAFIECTSRVNGITTNTVQESGQDYHYAYRCNDYPD